MSNGEEKQLEDNTPAVVDESELLEANSVDGATVDTPVAVETDSQPVGVEINPKNEEELVAERVFPMPLSEMERHAKELPITELTIDQIKGENVEKVQVQGSNGLEIELDMSKVELDSNNVPIFNGKDKDVLKRSGLFTDNDYLSYIESARTTISVADDELDLEEQKKIEEFHTDIVKNLEESLKTEIDEKKKDEIRGDIGDNLEVIRLLPKNNKEEYDNIQQKRLDSVKLIATYQLLARVDIQNLIASGASLSFISHTSISAFIGAYITAYQDYTGVYFDKDEDIVAYRKKIDSNKKEITENNKNFLDNGAELNKLVKKQEKLYINEAKLKGIIDVKERKKYVEDHLAEYKNTDTILESFRVTNKVVSARNDELVKENDDLEDKISNKLDELSKPIRNKLYSQGLAVSILEYSRFVEVKRPVLYKVQSYFQPEYTKHVSENFFFLIRTLIKENIDEEFAMVKTNVNNVSMFQPNFIYYIENLFSNKILEEWALKFDEKSQLKQFYLDNTDYIEKEFKIVEKYKEAKESFFKMVKNNQFFYKHLQMSANDLYDTVNKFESSNYNAKGKNKYKTHMQIAFITQYLVGVREFLLRYDDKEEKESFTAFFDSFLHNVLGNNVIEGFLAFSEYCESKYNNKGLIKDIIGYLFNENILSLLTLKLCDKDQRPFDYMKDKTKEIVFKSSNFAFMKEMDINIARKILFREVFYMISDYMTNFVTMYEKANENDRNEEENGEKEGKEQRHKLTKEEILRKQQLGKKNAKKKAREGEKSLEKGRLVKEWYKDVIHNKNYKVYETNGFKLLEKDNYNLYWKVSLTKDNVALVKLNIFNRSYKDIINEETVNYDVRRELDALFGETFSLEDYDYTERDIKMYFNELEKRRENLDPNLPPDTYRELLFAHYKTVKEEITKDICSIINEKAKLDENTFLTANFKVNTNIKVRYLDKDRYKSLSKLGIYLDALDWRVVSFIICFDNVINKKKVDKPKKNYKKTDKPTDNKNKKGNNDKKKNFNDKKPQNSEKKKEFVRKDNDKAKSTPKGSKPASKNPNKTNRPTNKDHKHVEIVKSSPSVPKLDKIKREPNPKKIK
jgi:hypothetical protein